MSDETTPVEVANVEAPEKDGEKGTEKSGTPTTEMEQQQLVQDEGEGLREQQTPGSQKATEETASATAVQPDDNEVVAAVTTDDQTETKEEIVPEEERQPTDEENTEVEAITATKEVTKKDKDTAKEEQSAGEVTEPEAHKSDDGKGALSSPETKKKKDKKKRKGSKKREESPESSRAVPKLRKRSSRSDGSGSQGRTSAAAQQVDLLEDIVAGIFQAADVTQQGFLTRDDYIQLLQSERLGHFSTDDLMQYLAHFDQLPTGVMTYADFKPIGHNLILMYYRTADTSASEWCPLQSPKVGLFFLNKHTGQTQLDPPPGFEHLAVEAGQAGREHDIDFLSRTYADLEAVNRELENERERHKATMNELARANEELENVATQLYETGQTLDESNAELQAKDADITQLQAEIAQRDEEIARLNNSVMELQVVQQELDVTKQSFLDSENTAKERNLVVTEKESAISTLRYQFESLTDQIKTARGVIDARDSTIEQLHVTLEEERKLKEQLQDHVSQLQKEVAQLVEGLQNNKLVLDEKISALSLARKQLRNTRERNSELEKGLEKMNTATDKLRAAECEIRTLKSFLTSKTAIMERRKKELKEMKEHVTELEDKDQKRTFILADVLEKTARLQQDVTAHQTSPTHRPSSAPHEGNKELEVDLSASKGHSIASHKHLQSMPLSQSFRSTRTTQSKASRKSQTSHRLPPITTPRSKSDFMMPTKKELRNRQKEADAAAVDHSYTNPNCQCFLCKMDDTLEMSGPEGFGSDMQHELALSQQVGIGDRVIIQIKKSMYDLEPHKVTGIVKYVGRVDSEFVDSRVYVGVKLDEPYGNTDGVMKGKRYFKCPSKHGRFVRITNILSVLPSRGMFYRPLVDPAKQPDMFRIPTTGANTNSNRSSAHSVKVL
ncbi:myosin heavy chain, striated muscle-like isoform X2 [Dysidea avara]|uniref:myosin heavy chain, striated muscle-like isoform X2 n=1 Tax=Dysidea avara TaxID=196820 RepID=UPI00332E8146